MISEIEQLFINTFIDKRISERMIFEFKSISKRKAGQDRFAHSTDKIINRKKLVTADKKLTVDEIIAFIKQYNKNEFCYTIVGHYEFEGKETNLKKALDAADNWPGHSAIFVLPNIAIIIEEQCFGPPTRYILLSKTNN